MGLQELNSYFIGNHLKDILKKSENGKILSNNDRVELVRVAGDFLIFKNGSKPSVDVRKSIAHILHEQFPGLDQGMWYKKLTQRIKNRNRKKSSSGDHENENEKENQASNFNKAEIGNGEYLDYENLEESGESDTIWIDGEEQSDEDYEKYEV